MCKHPSFAITFSGFSPYLVTAICLYTSIAHILFIFSFHFSLISWHVINVTLLLYVCLLGLSPPAVFPCFLYRLFPQTHFTHRLIHLPACCVSIQNVLFTGCYPDATVHLALFAEFAAECFAVLIFSFCFLLPTLFAFQLTKPYQNFDLF